MLILYAILFFAFLLRIAALFFGFPLDVFGDEIAHTIVAFKAISAKSLFIPLANEAFLPPLMAYMLIPIFLLIGGLGMASGVFSGIADFKEFVILNKELFLVPGRIISALFGVATIYFLYLLVKKIFNEKIALLSAFLLSINFLHVHESQFGHIWSPTTFFFVAGAYFCYMLYTEGGRKWYYLSALAAGLGYAIGQIPILIFILLIATHLFRVKKTGEKFWNSDFKRACLAVFIIFVVFTILNPYTFYKHSIEPIGIILKIFGVKLESAYKVSSVVIKTSILGSAGMALKTIFYTDPLLFILGILGAFLFLKRNKNFGSVALLAFPLFYLAFMIIFTNFTYRYALPAIPFLLVFASYFIFYLYDNFFAGRKVVLALVVAVISFYSFSSSALYSALVLKPYTASRAIEWSYTNIPSGSRVVSDYYLNSDKESIELLGEHNRFDWLDSRKKLLLDMPDNKYPEPNYFLIDNNLTDAKSLPVEERTADYFLISFYDKKEEQEKLGILDSFLPKEKELVAKFYPRKEKINTGDFINFEPQWVLNNLYNSEYLGPYVEIYKAKK